MVVQPCSFTMACETPLVNWLAFRFQLVAIIMLSVAGVMARSLYFFPSFLCCVSLFRYGLLRATTCVLIACSVMQILSMIVSCCLRASFSETTHTYVRFVCSFLVCLFLFCCRSATHATLTKQQQQRHRCAVRQQPISDHHHHHIWCAYLPAARQHTDTHRTIDIQWRVRVSNRQPVVAGAGRLQLCVHTDVRTDGVTQLRSLVNCQPVFARFVTP